MKSDTRWKTEYDEDETTAERLRKLTQSSRPAKNLSWPIH